MLLSQSSNLLGVMADVKNQKLTWPLMLSQTPRDYTGYLANKGEISFGK